MVLEEKSEQRPSPLHSNVGCEWTEVEYIEEKQTNKNLKRKKEPTSTISSEENNSTKKNKKHPPKSNPVKLVRILLTFLIMCLAMLGILACCLYYNAESAKENTLHAINDLQTPNGPLSAKDETQPTRVSDSGPLSDTARQKINELRILKDAYLHGTVVGGHIGDIMSMTSSRLDRRVRIFSGQTLEGRMQDITRDVDVLTSVLRKGESLPSLIFSLFSGSGDEERAYREIIDRNQRCIASDPIRCSYTGKNYESLHEVFGIIVWKRYKFLVGYLSIFIAMVTALAYMLKAVDRLVDDAMNHRVNKK